MKLDINKIEEIMGKHRYVKVRLNKLHTWINERTKEGLQITANNEIVSFVAEHGERILTYPDSDEMIEIKREITLSNEPIKTEGVKKDETIKTSETKKEPETKTDDKKLVNEKFVNRLPAIFEGKNIIIPHDIEELTQMYPKTIDRMLLFQKTNPNFVKYLDKAKLRPYVEGNIMKQEANLAFLFKWGSKIDGWHLDKEGVACWGSIKVNIDGTDTIVSGVGIDIQTYRKDDKSPISTIAEMMKNANTDLKKKCLADLGFNSDVYRGEV